MIWPMLIAAGTAVAVLLVDLIFARWFVPLSMAVLGAIATGVSAFLVPMGQFSLLCASDGRCSYTFDAIARLVAILIAALTAFALLLYAPALRDRDAPAGEVGFLLASAMTGGVVLGGADDLITLIVALETLTLPLYALVALHRRRAGAGASASVTFFTTSIVATAVTLLGAALLYLHSGTVHLPNVMRETMTIAQGQSLAVVGLALLLTGLGFKVAAVPMHAWAPSTYDGAPIPIAAYLSTASKLGGVMAILFVIAPVSGDLAITAGITMAVLATLSLVIGTLVALRQRRTVRLLAWSSVAQAGFILAPLGGLAIASNSSALLSATLAYTIFFLALELGAFSGVVALRPRDDGGVLDDLRGQGLRAPARSAMFAFALIGLAGLPPALAGLFAKITVLKVLLDVGMIWLAVLVALISVVGLAVYWRPLADLYRRSPSPSPVAPVRARVTVIAPLIVATACAALLSIVPQLALSLWPQ